jgi:ornithine cyclodeaminase/alanine dehydrogenase-like protein (mu-crystallin family)
MSNGSETRLRFLSDTQVRTYLYTGDVLQELRDVVQRVAIGSVECPARVAMGRGSGGKVTHLMAAKDVANERVVTKLVDYDARRPYTTGLPSLLGVVTYTVSGEVAFICRAGEFTNIRTAAATALAVDVLAPNRAEVLTIFGAGPLGRETALAISSRRDLKELRIVSRTAESAQRLAASLAPSLGIPVIAVKEGSRKACMGADIVITVTSAVEPILSADDIDPGTLVAAIGSGTVERRELPGDLVARANLIVVETVEAAQTEAGDLIQAAAEGFLDMGTLTPLADLLRDGYQPDDSGLAIYKSVGAAWQDLACANVIWRQLEADAGAHSQ